MLHREKYIRVPKNNAGALQYLVNKTLFSGTYTLVNSSLSSLVKFENDGKVSGFTGFSTFYISTDFVASPENNIDEVHFDIQTANQKNYAFKINEDTIKLFDLIEIPGRDSISRRQIKYTLVKKQGGF